ncbi:hypothetical protein AHAS_Ahas02G0034700 [Arachis hypogaea]
MMPALKRNLKVNKLVLCKNLKHSHLISAMEALVYEDGVVLLGYQVRSSEAHKKFWEMCLRASRL